MEITDILESWETTEWECFDEEEEATVPPPTDVAQAYIDSLTRESGLHLQSPDETEQAYNAHDEKGIFGIFVSKKLKQAWHTWANAALIAKGDDPLTGAEIDAYIGLEMAVGLIPITDINGLWSDKQFLGHPDFKATMSRNRFQAIRGSLKVHPHPR